MFYLRKVEKESKRESNISLGGSYVYEHKDLVNKDRSTDAFAVRCLKVLDCMSEDKIINVFAIVYDSNGRAVPLFHDSDNYIVTENGNTYAKLK